MYRLQDLGIIQMLNAPLIEALGIEFLRFPVSQVNEINNSVP